MGKGGGERIAGLIESTRQWNTLVSIANDTFSGLEVVHASTQSDTPNQNCVITTLFVIYLPHFRARCRSPVFSHQPLTPNPVRILRIHVL